jgi:hypothetical protein
MHFLATAGRSKPTGAPGSIVAVRKGAALPRVFWILDFKIQRFAHGLDILRDKNRTVLKCRLEKAD